MFAKALVSRVPTVVRLQVRSVYHSSKQQTRICQGLITTQKRGFFNRKPLDFDPKVDYYKILEVKEGASQQEIKNAYYRLAQFYHPDRNNGQFVDKFKDITNAYQILSDAEKRKRYDALRKGEADPEGGFGGFGTGWSKHSSTGQQSSGQSNYGAGPGFDAEKMKKQFEEFFKKQQSHFNQQKQQFQERMKQQQGQQKWKQQQGYGSNFNDKKKLVHGLFMVFGGLIMFRLLFGGRRHAYPEDYYQGGPPGYPGHLPQYPQQQYYQPHPMPPPPPPRGYYPEQVLQNQPPYGQPYYPIPPRQ